MGTVSFKGIKSQKKEKLVTSDLNPIAKISCLSWLIYGTPWWQRRFHIYLDCQSERLDDQRWFKTEPQCLFWMMDMAITKEMPLALTAFSTFLLTLSIICPSLSFCLWVSISLCRGFILTRSFLSLNSSLHPVSLSSSQSILESWLMVPRL